MDLVSVVYYYYYYFQSRFVNRQKLMLNFHVGLLGK